jgi:O-antigen/teichoic acid export membrane protein
MKPAHRIALFGVASASTAVANLAISVTIGRWLGASALATFALAVAIARVFYAATDFGIAFHLTRVVARDMSKTRDLASLFLSLRGVLIVVSVIVSMTIACVVDPDDVVVFLAVAMAQGMITIHAVYDALFLGHERPGTSAAITIAISVLVLASCGIWIVGGHTLVQLTTWYALAMCVGTAVWTYRARTHLDFVPRHYFALGVLRDELKASLPIGISILLGIAAMRTPLFVLSIFVSERETGAFVAADMMVTAIAIFQGAVTNATYPRLAASCGIDPSKFRRTYWLGNIVLLVAGSGMALFLSLGGLSIAVALFPGKDFGPLTSLLPIMVWSAPALLLVQHNILVFAAANRERANSLLMISWLVITAVFQLTLVPTYGVVGAAWGLLLGRAACLVVIAVVSWATRVHRGTQLA